MTGRTPDLGRVWAGARQAAAGGEAPALRTAWLDAPEAVAAEADRLVHGGRTVGRVRPHGSVVLLEDGPGRPRRWAELDRQGRVSHLIHRRLDGTFEGAAVRVPGAGWIGLLAAGGRHPLWGPADLVVGPLDDRKAPPGLPALRGAPPLTVAGRVDWDAIDVIPPLAQPAALPPGAGSALLGLLASLARDQGAPALRYRGPFPTEQLFWSLTEAFHVVEPHPGVAAAFTADAEEAFRSGRVVEPAVAFIPAPRERLLSDDLLVELRDGVEKVTWEGRAYHRPDWSPGWPELRRRGHRVIRIVGGPPGGRRFEAGLVALGRPVAAHVVLAEDGEVLAWPDGAAPEPGATAAPLAGAWREALGALLPLDATPLLATAIAVTWPGLAVSWGPVHRDLVVPDAAGLRLSLDLAQLHRRATREPATDPRALARQLVREVLELVGPFVRQAAAAWLEAEPPARRAAHLEAAARLDRRRLAAEAGGPLARLLEALVAGRALPRLD